MSQQSQILRHLKRRPITAIDALKEYQCFRLAARIIDLREDGHDIQTDIIEYRGKRFAQYRLAK
jgi:hypothetical protein